MKKFLKSTLFIFVCAFASLALVACKQTPTKIELKAGTLTTTVEVGDELDFSRVVIRVTYSDKTYEDVAKNDDMTFSQVDTSTVGEKNLVITYLDLETTVKITVVNNIEETYTVIGFEMPESFNIYVNNSKKVVDNPATSEDESENYYKLANQTYKVGDDNNFVFKPIITALNDRDEVVTLNTLACDYSVAVLEDSEYRNLTETEISNTVNIDESNFAFDFVSSAVGNKYKITITPQDETLDALSFEIEVVDGYNVHNVKELSVLDNNQATASMWQKFKQQNNIPSNVDSSAIILHNNMQITMQDIPSAYIYNQGDADATEQMIGTLRDRKSIYTHNTPEGTTFTLYGNYFQIDATQIALVPIAELKNQNPDRSNFGHSALISFGGDNNYAPTTVQGNVVVDTVKFMGNSSRSEDTANAGGLIMTLNASNKITINNVISRAWNTHFISTTNRGNGDWETTSIIQNSKFYDSFSNMLYYYGVKNNYIINSVLSGSGGPMIYLVHVQPGTNTTTRYANMEIVNSKITALVQGTEAWFAYNTATSIATSLLSTDQLIKGTSEALASGLSNYGVQVNKKTFTQNGKGNFMVMFAGDDPLGNTYDILGKVVVKDAEGNVIHTHDMANQIYKATMQGINQVMPGAGKLLPFFESDKGVLLTVTVDSELNPNGLGKVTTSGYSPLFSQDNPTDMEAENIQRIQNFFDGEYLGLYAPGGTIGALLEYYDVE